MTHISHNVCDNDDTQREIRSLYMKTIDTLDLALSRHLFVDHDRDPFHIHDALGHIAASQLLPLHVFQVVSLPASARSFHLFVTHTKRTKNHVHKLKRIFCNSMLRSSAAVERRRSLTTKSAALVMLYRRKSKTIQEGQHPLTGQRAANFRLLANQ